MGRMIEGRWVDDRVVTVDDKGRFVRMATTFRERVAAPLTAGRHHLIVSYACPWAHRTLIARSLKGLRDRVSVAVVEPFMGDDGWSFGEAHGADRDPLYDVPLLRELYARAKADFTGRVTVPVLWDRETARIVNNESREIVEMFDELGDPRVSLYPPALREEIDATIDAIYQPINNGVYRAGFARSQTAYDEAVGEVFAALAHYDRLLASRRYLCGDTFTAADICLFTTLIRFDVAYHYHFKCNLKRIADYEHLSGYLRELYQMPGVRETVRLDHIKVHYFTSHESINPSRIVPRGPELDLDTPHRRATIPAGSD